ncbi:MAG: hypothetical protein J7M39_06475, partial [Anaerolineae bacterium]|nr:hypothetical protein [Anaerolineae bacterium]
DVLRWLLLLQFSNLMLDVLLGYLALYFVDVAQVTLTQTSTAVAVWTGVGLLGDLLIIRLLTHVSGLRYLRVSAAVELLLFCGFLLISAFAGKLLLLALLGILQRRLVFDSEGPALLIITGTEGRCRSSEQCVRPLRLLDPVGLGVCLGECGFARDDVAVGARTAGAPGWIAPRLHRCRDRRPVK